MQGKLIASPREETGKQAMKRMRQRGRIPAVLYGHQFEPRPLSLDEKALRAMMRHEKGLHGLLKLEVEGTEDGDFTVVVKELQRHPLRDEILHVDFQRIRSDEELHAEVSLRFTGEPVGVRAGGILQHYLYEVTVACLPADLPEEIEVDVSRLNLKENLRIRDLPRFEGVRYINNPEEIVAAVTPKRVREVVREVTEFAFEEEGEEAEAEAAQEAAPKAEAAVEPATEEEAAGPSPETPEAGAGEES